MLTRMNKILHSSLLAVLFSRVVIRRWDSHRATAALNIEPHTWVNVRNLEVTIDLNAGAGELLLYRNVPPVFKHGDNMWRSYFHLLPPLRKLVVNISAGTLSPETTIRVLESGFWQRFLNLLTQSNTPTALLEASSLELHWTGAKHIPPSSEAWRLIKVPFLKFKNV